MIPQSFLIVSAEGMEKVVCISAAKVPIVKIWDPELGLACDMNVNNTLALENTRMVRTYVEIDPRVRPLAMIVKYWTRKRIVNDAGMTCLLLLQYAPTDRNSLRRHTQFLHVDLPDHRIPATPRPASPSVTAPATTPKAL